MRVKQEQLQQCWTRGYSSQAVRTTSSWALLNSELLCELAGLQSRPLYPPLFFPHLLLWTMQTPNYTCTATKGTDCFEKMLEKN